MIKKFLYIVSFCLLTQVSFGASDSSSSSTEADLYKKAEKILNSAKKFEKNGKTKKAINLYNNAYKKLVTANNEDKNNPDILNYLGFSLRKMGKYDEAEKFYLSGLKIKPDHNGINEYLGELYVKTQRMDLAKERLAVLKNCNCEEYSELEEVIKNN